MTGLFLGNVSVDIPLSNTYFVVAHFHMVMGVSPVLAVFGGIYHWYPKISGRMYNDALGKLHFWITFLGAYAIFFPMHYLGVLGMPRRYYAYENYQFIPPSAQLMNEFITIARWWWAWRSCCSFSICLQHLQGQGGRRQSVARRQPEWLTPQTPPVHGNWGRSCRWCTAARMTTASRPRERLHSAERGRMTSCMRHPPGAPQAGRAGAWASLPARCGMSPGRMQSAQAVQLALGVPDARKVGLVFMAW